MNTRSIGIIGLGWVGASTALSILHGGICKELLLNDLKPGLAEGEAMDLNHGSSFYPPATVKAVEIQDMKHCDAIVITAGKGGTAKQSRLELLKDNVGIARGISSQLNDFRGILIIVANPVDVLTYFYQQFSSLPPSRVIGTGTMLDTARLRDITGSALNLDPRSIHAQVVGEHGDSEVVLWSSAQIGGVPLREYGSWQEKLETVIANEVKTAAYEIISRKGSTNHAIGLVTAALLKWMLRGERRVMTVSSVINGTLGLHNVALSLPSVVSEQGVEEILAPAMSQEERESLHHSANILKKAIQDAGQ